MSKRLMQSVPGMALPAMLAVAWLANVDSD
jgi:hypothetical protein